MKVLRISFIAFVLLSFSSASLMAQCETWNNSPKKEEAENAHVLYRGIVKGKDAAELEQLSAEEFKMAYNNWKKAYDIAPAADGQRPSHYSDGRNLLKVKYKRATDEAEKKEIAAKILELYDQQAQCYENEAFLMGRKAFDMFYMPEYGYRESTYEAFKKALELGGMDSEYILLEPMAQILVYFYKSDKVDQVEAQRVYTQLEEIADYNVENNERFGQYYESSKARMSAHFKEIEDEVFDCTYFKKKLLPQYEENKDSLKIIQYVYVKLRQQGCDTTEAKMMEIRSTYEALAARINAELEVERRKNNPCYDASQLQQEGEYSRALTRYEECLETTTDAEARAQVYYSIASIKLYRQNNTGGAVSAARQAASLKSGWGRPYLLIGDAYAKMGRNCDDWESRLAVLAAIEKYAYARSIDPEVADDANKRIGQYSDAMPARQDGFMRGLKEGQSVSVGCGIGETVKLRFKD
ncbi:MAG: hypothetical protein J5I94_04015 [Phaeodactylibacter sp.]|nr:hypothetical protein [Phaeodactylibacter sp.]